MNTRTRAFIDEREPGTRIGRKYSLLISRIRDRMRRNNNDFTFVVAGPTGSGKSTLLIHTHKIWIEGERIPADVYGFDEQSWALALEYVDEHDLDYVVYDEGNKSRRRSTSGENVEFIDLLFNIRYKNWCKGIANPSVDYLDKALIEDNLVNAVIYIYAEQKRFYFFTRKRLHQLLKDKGNLKHNTIMEHGKQYALLDSYFLSYDGDEWDEYEVRKEALTNEKLREYINKRKKGPTMSAIKAAQTLGVDKKTVYRHLEAAIENNELDVKDVRNPAGTYQLSKTHIDFLAERMGT